MNIFILDKDPKKAAQYLCDKHVPKMVLESAQLLCSAYQTETPYKKTHLNHPCSIWVRESLENYKWLLDYSYFLAEEYTERYRKVHKSLEVIKWCDEHKDELIFKDNELTPFVQVMPNDYKGENTVEAYREYYRNEKLKFARWRLGEPSWVRETF